MTADNARLSGEIESLRQETGILPLTDDAGEDIWDDLSSEQQAEFSKAEDELLAVLKDAPKDVRESIFAHLRMAIRLARRHKVKNADLTVALEKTDKIVSLKYAAEKSAQKKRDLRERFRKA